jgi:hypothetical protein
VAAVKAWLIYEGGPVVGPYYAASGPADALRVWIRSAADPANPGLRDPEPGDAVAWVGDGGRDGLYEATERGLLEAAVADDARRRLEEAKSRGTVGIARQTGETIVAQRPARTGRERDY